jgi:hypothetical protein
MMEMQPLLMAFRMKNDKDNQRRKRRNKNTNMRELKINNWLFNL